MTQDWGCSHEQHGHSAHVVIHCFILHDVEAACKSVPDVLQLCHSSWPLSSVIKQGTAELLVLQRGTLPSWSPCPPAGAGRGVACLEGHKPEHFFELVFWLQLPAWLW